MRFCVIETAGLGGKLSNDHVLVDASSLEDAVLQATGCDRMVVLRQPTPLSWEVCDEDTHRGWSGTPPENQVLVHVVQIS